MKRIPINNIWSVEKPLHGAGFHLYEKREVPVKKGEGISKGKKIIEKIHGYNIPLKEIILIITEDSAWDKADTFLELVKSIEEKVDSIKVTVLSQLLSNIK